MHVKVHFFPFYSLIRVAEKFYNFVCTFFFTDPRVPIDHKVTLHFSDTQTNENRGIYFQSPLVKLEPINALAKYNSLERFDDGKYLS